MEKKVFSQSKMERHPDRVADYIAGKKIFPITMELDTTQVCNRACSACPHSTSSQRAHKTLDLKFLDRLFGTLGPNTPGLLLTGGEPTIVPHFKETLALAKAKGFKDIAIISNGFNIDKPDIQDALMEYATAIRISQYDWQDGESESFLETLKKIENFKSRIDREKSGIHLSTSTLTQSKWIPRFEGVMRRVMDAGADWAYFHPFIKWETTSPALSDQDGVVEEIERIKSILPAAEIQYPAERYLKNKLQFDKLHGSYFLFQLGADGISYAGTDCKYEPEYATIDLNEYFKEDFLWHPRRTRMLSSINSANYRHISLKHRPSVFSHYIQSLIGGDTNMLNRAKELEYAYENII